jgi:hypothetical protein
MTEPLKDFRERIKHRRVLYRSLARRGIIKGDPSLNSLDGSVYDVLGQILRSGGDAMSPVELAERCENCYNLCKNIYTTEDEQLLDYEPLQWHDFLMALKSTAENPDQFDYYHLEQILQTALSEFMTELMALDYPQAQMD